MDFHQVNTVNDTEEASEEASLLFWMSWEITVGPLTHRTAPSPGPGPEVGPPPCAEDTSRTHPPDWRLLGNHRAPAVPACHLQGGDMLHQTMMDDLYLTPAVVAHASFSSQLHFPSALLLPAPPPSLKSANMVEIIFKSVFPFQRGTDCLRVSSLTKCWR